MKKLSEIIEKYESQILFHKNNIDKLKTALKDPHCEEVRIVLKNGISYSCSVIEILTDLINDLKQIKYL